MQRVVVIGGVAAGLKAASKLRRDDPTAQITVLEKGAAISYGACGMPYFVAGDVPDVKDLWRTPVGQERTPEYFRGVKDIQVHTRTLAQSINRAARTVTVKDLATGEVRDVPYDKLVLATGAQPVRPPLPGVDLPGVFQLWHPDDAAAIRQRLESGQVQHAVIIGAGLIGMETAEALRQWDVDVTVVEMQPTVFPAFLDDEVARAVQKYAATQGVTFLTGEKVVEFVGDNAVWQVVTDKRALPADLVVLAIGARPNVALAREAGLTLGKTGAIAVNEHLQTSDPLIYAGGDCVENTHLITGDKVYLPMGSTANKHGRVIGENLAGGEATFRGVLGTVAVKVFDWRVGKTGLTEREARDKGYNYVTAMTTGHDRPHYYPAAKLMTVKLVVDADSRRILGAQAFGLGEVTKRIDVIAALLTMGGTIDDLAAVDLSYAPPFNNPIDNAVVAANTVMNKLAGRFHGIAPGAAHEKQADPQVTFLDVRTPGECAQLRLAGCKNVKYIPLGQLRQHLAELGRDGEIVAVCKIGVRGYEAAAILGGAGINDVKVLEGGVFAWPYACETGPEAQGEKG